MRGPFNISLTLNYLGQNFPKVIYCVFDVLDLKFQRDDQLSPFNGETEKCHNFFMVYFNAYTSSFYRKFNGKTEICYYN